MSKATELMNVFSNRMFMRMSFLFKKLSIWCDGKIIRGV